MLRARDMTMLETLGSLERDEEDWKRLLATADWEHDVALCPKADRR